MFDFMNTDATPTTLFDLVQGVELEALTYFELLSHKSLIEFALQEEPGFSSSRINILLGLMNEVEAHLLVTAPEDFGAELEFLNHNDFVFDAGEAVPASVFEAPTVPEPLKFLSK